MCEPDDLPVHVGNQRVHRLLSIEEAMPGRMSDFEEQGRRTLAPVERIVVVP
jgi:hypothetical protein